MFNYSGAKPENTEKSQLMIVDKMIVQTLLEVNERERERDWISGTNPTSVFPELFQYLVFVYFQFQYKYLK